jgi:hypothetical protein
MSQRGVLLCVWLLVPVAFCQSSGTIQGTIKDDSGNPVAKAYTVATRQSPLDHSTYGSNLSDASGAFAFTGLPAGLYSLCVHTPGGSYLNPCQWAKDTQVNVGPDETVSNVQISVTTGSLFQVRINDPHGILTASDDLMVGVYLASGIFQPMRLAASDPSGRTYDAAVPLSTQIRLFLTSTHLQLSNSSGNGLPSSASPIAATATTMALPGQSQAKGTPVVFTISGRK